MENSGRIFADSADSAEWYVVVGDRWLGPMSVPEILEKISLGDLTWAHFAWRKGESGWKRICDLPGFQAAVPEKPTQQIQKQVKTLSTAQTENLADPRAKAPGRNWYLYYNDSQFGPFSMDEMRRYLTLGKIHVRVHAWRDGMEGWTRIEDLSEFSDVISPKGLQKAEKKEEQRGTLRRPLVAKLFLTDTQEVVIAVCRDISTGGMQVLTDKVPGGSGTRVKMNVSPSGSNHPKILPFVAEGVIVRVLEDGRGFSFRFDKLEDSARLSIENYIALVEGHRS